MPPPDPFSRSYIISKTAIATDEKYPRPWWFSVFFRFIRPDRPCGWCRSPAAPPPAPGRYQPYSPGLWSCCGCPCRPAQWRPLWAGIPFLKKCLFFCSSRSGGCLTAPGRATGRKWEIRLFFLIIQPAVAVPLEIRVCDLLLKLLAHTFVLRCPL